MTETPFGTESAPENPPASAMAHEQPAPAEQPAAEPAQQEAKPEAPKLHEQVPQGQPSWLVDLFRQIEDRL